MAETSNFKETYQIIQEWDGLYYVNYVQHYGDHVPYCDPLRKTEYSKEYASFKTIEEAEDFIKFHKKNNGGPKVIKTYTTLLP